MMTANIQWGKGTFNDRRGGEVLNVLSSVGLSTRVPLFELGSATLLLEYVVPSGKVDTLKNILVTVMPPQPMFNTALYACRMGTALLVVDGTTKAEVSIQNYPFQSPSTMWTVDWPNGDRCPSVGEGVDFTNGQVVKVQVTPLDITAGLVLPSKWIARLHGKNPVTGVADLRIGILRSPPMSSVLDILSYTAPADGFRLMSWDVTGVYADPWCATIQVYLNGSCIAELGYLSFMGEGATVFSPHDHGVINLLKGGWGIKLNHGDRVEVWAHAQLDFGQAAAVQMACDETAELGVQAQVQIGLM